MTPSDPPSASGAPPQRVPPEAPPLVVRAVADAASWEAARAIRERVFVREQACPPEEEWDAHDWPTDRGASCRHLLGVAGEQPVAACRWRPVEMGPLADATGGAPEARTSEAGTPAAAPQPWAKLERFAVLPEARGHGYGRAMVEAAMADARARGHRRLVLSAQEHLQAFYGAWGFRPVGGTFWEAGIPHVKMTLEG